VIVVDLNRARFTPAHHERERGAAPRSTSAALTRQHLEQTVARNVVGGECRRLAAAELAAEPQRAVAIDDRTEDRAAPIARHRLREPYPGPVGPLLAALPRAEPVTRLPRYELRRAPGACGLPRMVARLLGTPIGIVALPGAEALSLIAASESSLAPLAVVHSNCGMGERLDRARKVYECSVSPQNCSEADQIVAEREVVRPLEPDPAGVAHEVR